jgi:polysaccharide chain length determinant protein (PEP-CTERM system associated)
LTEQKSTINIKDIADALIKKWYWVSMSLIFFILAGIWFYVVLPKSYEATTLILVQPQEIPQNYVQSTISQGVDEQVRSLSQEVLSRSNLEPIINELHLFARERENGTSIDVLIESLRKKIKIDTNLGQRGGSGYFSITYRGSTPKDTADVTNRLASYFIDSNLRLRAQQATETTIFLQKQLDELQKLLLQQEAKVQEYRNKYLGELPDQLQSNVTTITGLQTRLESVQTSLTAAINRKVAVQDQLSQAEAGIAGVGGTSSPRDRLTDLKSQLDEMRAKYTPEHPEIKRLQDQIAELEKQSKKRSTVDPRVLDLRTQLKNANAEVEALRRDADGIKARIEQYQGRVEATPKREQEFAALSRDYNITQQNYQKLLDRLYEAKRAEDMEKRQQGGQFRVVDYAQPPGMPVSPNPIKIAMIFLAMGIGAGAGIIVLLEALDTTIKGIRHIEGLSANIPCITAVPLALTKEDKRRQKTMNLMFAGINGTILIVGAVIILASRLTGFVLNSPVPLPF